MIKPILHHIATDPNAPIHQKLGVLGAFSSCIFFYSFDLLMLSLLGLLLGGLVMGIFIELVQRIQRIGRTQNTIKESVLDVLVTATWPLMFINTK